LDHSMLESGMGCSWGSRTSPTRFTS
jgi:hypothetical protein